MQLQPWDPLEAQLSAEVMSATIKREIQNILKSYTGWYDPLSELVQNSLDSLEARAILGDKFEPRVWLTIDLKSNTISVTDNGTCLTQAQLQTFLAPNVSYKQPTERGNKGVGATYLGYGFNFLQIGTKTKEFNFVGTLKDGRKWVEDKAGVVGRPIVTPDNKAIHDPFEKIDRGATFSLRLIGEFIRPKDLAWVNATSAEQWAPILRLKTPLGGVYPEQEPPKTICELTVIDAAGAVTSKSLSPCVYLYPHTVISACQPLSEIREKLQALLNQGKDPNRLPDVYKNLNGLFNFWKPEDLLKGEFDKAFSGNEAELIKSYRVNCYGFMCYSTDIWDTYNDDVIKLRKGFRLLRGGVQLCTNGMPQGEPLVIPLRRNIGYQNVTHVLVHFAGADPDLGRKGFQPELEQLSERISVAVVGVFLVWRRHLKKDTGAPPDIVSQKNVHEWIKLQESHEATAPLLIKRKDVFLPTSDPSTTSEPLNEQDVIALFNQLLAGGVIRGIRLMSTSQHQQYDGVFRYVLKEPTHHHIFDKATNPLRLDQAH